MWIRTQNRQRLIKVNDIFLRDIPKVKNNEVVVDGVGVYGNDGEWLGKYETVEKAIEVLNKIEQWIEDNSTEVFNMPTTE